MIKKIFYTLTLIVVIWGVSLSAPLDEDHSPNSADLVLQNGKIMTLAPKNSIAQAVAIKGDKILAVGTNYQIMF